MNKSTGSEIVDSINFRNSSNIDKIVASNNKYIYSIFDVNNNLQYLGNNKVMHLTNGDVSIHEVSNGSSIRYLVYNVENVDGTKTKYAVATALLGNDISKADRKFYTTTYVDDLTRNYEKGGTKNNPYEEDYKNLMKIHVLAQEFDSSTASNSVYNISSSNIGKFDYKITNYIDFVKFNANYSNKLSDNIIKLADNIFTITIADEYRINSGKFSTKMDKGQVEAKSINGQNSLRIDAKLVCEIVTNANGESCMSIKIKLRINYGENGSLPAVTIMSGGIDETTGKKIDFVGYNFYGFMVDYSISNSSDTANTDTIYKPTGTEKLGTINFDSSVSSFDSHYSSNDGPAQGFFGNIYSGEATSSSYFKLPNMNVKVTLLYQRALKEVNAEIQLVTDKSKSEDIMNQKAVNKSSIFNLLTSSTKSGIYEKTSGNDSNLTVFQELWSENLLKGGINAPHSGKIDPTQIRESGFFIEHYYIYIVENAYPISWALGQLKKDGTPISSSDRSKAEKLYFYLMTFDHESIYEKTKRYPEFIFEKSGEYSYTEVYNLIVRNYNYLSKISDKPNNLSLNLPVPKNVEGYLRLRKIDAFTFAIASVNSNFSQNHIGTNDIVLMSLKLKEKYMHETRTKNNWMAAKSYAYIDYARTDFNTNRSTKTTKLISTPAEFINMNVTGSTAYIQNQDFDNAMAEFFRSDKAYVGTYRRTVYGSLASSVDEFLGNGSAKVKQLKSTTIIHSFTTPAEDESYIASSDYGSRQKTAVYDYINRPINSILAEGANWASTIANFLPGPFNWIVKAAAVTTAGIASIGTNASTALNNIFNAALGTALHYTVIDFCCDFAGSDFSMMENLRNQAFG